MRDYRFYVEDSSRRGRMNDPTVASLVTGSCGDTMEFYLVIKDDFIETAWYYADGCAATEACGAFVAEWVEGLKIQEALRISPYEVITYLKELPEDHYHCAVLAVLSFLKSAGEYMLLPKY